MAVVYDRGGVELRAERREVAVNAGDVAIVDFGRSTERLTAPSASMTFLLPRDSLEPLTTGLDHIHGMVIPGGAELNRLLQMQMQFLLTHAMAFSEPENLNLLQFMAHLLAAGIGAADGTREQTAEAMSAARLRQVCRVIDADLANPELGPDHLITLCRISRASFYRMFEPLGGISGYIQRPRQMRAHRDLIDPVMFHLRVSAIGQLWNFSEPAAFSRAYKKAFRDAAERGARPGRAGLSHHVWQAGAGRCVAAPAQSLVDRLDCRLPNIAQGLGLMDVADPQGQCHGGAAQPPRRHYWIRPKPCIMCEVVACARSPPVLATWD